MPITATELPLSFVNFKFKTELVAPLLTRKSTNWFPSVSCTQHSCGEMEISAIRAIGAPGQPQSSS